jgi:transposase
MKDTDFYQQILGLKEPWEVRGVDLSVEGKRVTVTVGYREGTLWACPESQERLPCHDHVERHWRHLDTCGFETIVEARVPRVRGSDGKVWTIPVPWAEKGSRFTLMFEGFVVRVLLACRSLSAAEELVGLSWDQLHRIMERAVSRGLASRDLEHLRYLGLDEKSFAKGQSYVSVMTDLEAARVLEVMDGADQKTAELLLATLPDEVLEKIEAASIDMSGFFEAALRTQLPDVAIVHDRFHISAHLNDGVAKVHREENAILKEKGDRRLEGTQRLFGFDPGNLTQEQAVRFRELRDADLRTSRAWAIKEMFRHFWSYRYEGSARKFFKEWFGWASRSQLKPIIEVARMIKRHFENIITYLRHPITNAVTEGLNSKIQAIKANARGFRSFANYRIRILFFCGKLNLHPL